MVDTTVRSDFGQCEPGLVSIIIPTYKRPDDLRKAVESGLMQTYDHIEIVVVSDGPDPVARAAVEGIDPRVHYAELPTNRGPAAARNEGVALSRGEWLTFLDDDDLILPGKIEKQLALADRNSPQTMISCRAIYRAQGKDNIHPERPIGPSEDVADYILMRPSLTKRPGVLPLQSLLLHRSLLKKVPFTTHADHEDWAWLLEAWHLAGARVKFAWEPLVVYNIVVDSISRSRRTNWKDSLEWALQYRKWIGARAFASFLSTKVALKAKRSQDKGALQQIGRLVMASRPGWLELAFLAGIWLLPGQVLHHLWKKSLKSSHQAGQTAS
jgi:glycosyltransferase involved in cell wall biosynthesis